MLQTTFNFLPFLVNIHETRFLLQHKDNKDMISILIKKKKNK